MKKVLLSIIVLALMTSCYPTTTCVGTMKKHTPAVRVHSVWNHYLLGGLIPIGKNTLEDRQYVGENTDYKVKRRWTFMNGFLAVITSGIYTPTTTSYYLPIETRQQSRQHNNSDTYTPVRKNSKR